MNIVNSPKTPPYGHSLNTDGHLIIKDNSLCPWGEKALTFSLSLTAYRKIPKISPGV